MRLTLRFTALARIGETRFFQNHALCHKSDRSGARTSDLPEAKKHCFTLLKFSSPSHLLQV
ncbi:MAG: hypothetical protein ACRCUY_12070, partial [Thermoguttaceae bacterium]